MMTIAIMTGLISPVKDIPPTPYFVASTLQVQPARAQLAPAPKLLLGEIIIKEDAIAVKAVTQ